MVSSSFHQCEDQTMQSRPKTAQSTRHHNIKGATPNIHIDTCTFATYARLYYERSKYDTAALEHIPVHWKKQKLRNELKLECDYASSFQMVEGHWLVVIGYDGRSLVTQW